MNSAQSRLPKALLIAALVAGASYLLPVWWMNQQFSTGMDGVAEATRIVWKGAGVSLLALYAAVQAKSANGWLIAAIMASGALGDVLIDAIGLEAGAVAFAAGHIGAIALYWRHRRKTATGSQRLLGLILPPAVIYASWMMTADLGATLYAALLGVMASMAWTSAFPRYRTGIGAMLFVVSDLLIFARESGAVSGVLPSLAIWSLYFAGQLLIVMGVTQALAHRASGHVAV